MFDVAIIGAGPAGATLARLLSPHLRVLLADRRELDRPIAPGSPGKPCGGLLAPAAQRELARQGLGIPADVMSGPQLFAVRTLDLAAGLERLYQQQYLNVDREAFDRWLVDLACEDGRVETRWGVSLIGLKREPGSTVLEFRNPLGIPVKARARLVVGADGASSLVRRLAFPNRAAPDRYVAVQAAFDTVGAQPHYGSVFDRRLTDFYGWTIPKGDALHEGAAFPAGRGGADGRGGTGGRGGPAGRGEAGGRTASATDRFDTLVDRVREAGFLLGTERSRTSAAVLRPTSPTQLLAGDDAILLAGEAAGFISPSSAEGISYALRSAAALAEAIEGAAAAAIAPRITPVADGHLTGVAHRYRAAVAPVALSGSLRIGKAGVIYTPAVRHALMRSGWRSLGGMRGLGSKARGALNAPASATD